MEEAWTDETPHAKFWRRLLNENVDQLVNDDEFEALRRLSGKLGIEPNGACLVVAASPLGLHPSYEDALDLDAHARLPGGE